MVTITFNCLTILNIINNFIEISSYLFVTFIFDNVYYYYLITISILMCLFLYNLIFKKIINLSHNYAFHDTHIF